MTADPAFGRFSIGLKWNSRRVGIFEYFNSVSLYEPNINRTRIAYSFPNISFCAWKQSIWPFQVWQNLLNIELYSSYTILAVATVNLIKTCFDIFIVYVSILHSICFICFPSPAFTTSKIYRRTEKFFENRRKVLSSNMNFFNVHRHWKKAIDLRRETASIFCYGEVDAVTVHLSSCEEELVDILIHIWWRYRSLKEASQWNALEMRVPLKRNVRK